MARLFINHGTLLYLAENYDEAKVIFGLAKKTIDEMMLKLPVGSPLWISYNQISLQAATGIEILLIRELLKEKYQTEPSREELINVSTWMKLLPFANKIEYVKQIYEDKEFIKSLREIFNKILSREPQTWEILRYGDKWLAKKQGEKEINDIIEAELVNYPEYITKKDEEKKYNKLLE